MPEFKKICFFYPDMDNGLFFLAHHVNNKGKHQSAHLLDPVTYSLLETNIIGLALLFKLVSVAKDATLNIFLSKITKQQFCLLRIYSNNK